MPIYDSGARAAGALANVAANVAILDRDRDKVQTEAAELHARKLRARAAADPGAIEAEVEAVRAQNETLIAQNQRRETYDAFRRFFADGNPNHLNTLFKDNPDLRKLYGGIVSVSALDTEHDTGIMGQNGILMPQEGQKAGPNTYNPKVHLKATMGDGTTQLFNMRELAIGTGYMNYINNEELDMLIKSAQLMGELDDDSDHAPGELERDSTYWSELLGMPEEETALLFGEKKLGGVVMFQQRMADKTVEDMTEAFGGDEEFFATDFTQQANRVKVAKFIRRYEKFGGINLTHKDRADLKDLNTLVTMAKTVGDKLTPEVTGVIDTIYRDVKKYISDDVSETDKTAAASAYAAFRNTVRHALFGSALTDGEIAAFNEAFGTLKQSYPAVATQFITALEQTKSKLETIANLNDPYLAHYYMGYGGDDVSSVITSIQERIDFLSAQQGVAPGNTSTTANNTGNGDPANNTQQNPDKSARIEQKLNNLFGAPPESDMVE